MQAPHYEILEHTADAGIIARGATLAETFAHAAEGMYALMVDLDDVREVETRDMAVAGADLGRLLANWLVELIFLTETENLLFRRFDVTIDQEALSLRATAHGEPMDPERHSFGGAVKGVTRHLLEVEREDGGYRARVLFDM